MRAAFDIKLMPEKPFSFIVHLFDRILLGTTNDEREYGKLVQALDEDMVLEGHFFDGKKELYVAREDGQLVAYEPIIVGDEESTVIQRSYELEQAPYNTTGSGKARYTKLTVCERIAYEDDLAYVELTMLYSLEKGDAQ
ncbi:hypothetical protein SAMN05428987_5018 [Paenibacillus sp. CF095]|uniref:hypothetical protein n=1 Tax=Paenibacillus sp. CF095 TaxID=1881033 RepID=UPI00088F0FF7|nr:hypothetical protein [Paenibacillus sp. CF095]SDD50270.1 hypothetical protein SAMN05428987_5018 [Paenibacillus sp. CF095]